jgi:DNA polymerase
VRSSIFNLARLNPRVTAQHMPKRYWRNLPEAADIPMLALEAPVRATQMLAMQPRDTDRWARAAPERAPRQRPAPLEEAIGQCRRCALWERAVLFDHSMQNVFKAAGHRTLVFNR